MEKTERRLSRGIQNTVAHIRRLSPVPTRVKKTEDGTIYRYQEQTHLSGHQVEEHGRGGIHSDHQVEEPGRGGIPLEMTPSRDRDESPDRTANDTNSSCPSLSSLSKLISPDGKQDKVRFSTIFKGIVARILFLLHSFSMAQSVSIFWPEEEQMALFIPWGIFAFLMTCEVVISYILRQFSQWKWVCPSVLLYTVIAVPMIWALELRIADERLTLGVDKCLQLYSKFSNQSLPWLNDTTTTRIFNLQKAELSVVQQQIMVFLLLFGRWLLPKDQFSRMELAQLLLILVGSGEDIVEFSTETLAITSVACNKPLVIVILTFWTLSLVQFSIGLPAKIKRSKKCHDEKERDIEALDRWYDNVKILMERRNTVIETGRRVSTNKRTSKVGRDTLAASEFPAKFKNTLSRKLHTPHLTKGQRTRYKLLYTLYRKDIREALLTILLQDLPFLLIRIYVITNNLEVSLMFYGLKNIFVIGLHFYRFYAVYREYRAKQVTISPIFDNSFREFAQQEIEKNLVRRYSRTSKADDHNRHTSHKSRTTRAPADPGSNV